MIIHGDSLDILKTLEPNSVDAVVTDPPYGWRFMGKAWDAFDIAQKGIDTRAQKHEGEWRIGSDGKRRRYGKLNVPNTAAGSNDQSQEGNSKFQEFSESWAREVFRVLKPGGHMLVFCGPRTYHRMASGVEDAGFEIRDQLQWLFGSGFPKSHNIGEGRGTALKPANEPIVLARKPLSEKTVAANVLKWGCGALNIDASRIGTDSIKINKHEGYDSNSLNGSTKGLWQGKTETVVGRWPANLLLDEEAAAALDMQSGDIRSRHGTKEQGFTNGGTGSSWMFKDEDKGRGKKVVDPTQNGYLGGASRFFYVAKASKSERNRGLEGMPLKVSGGMSGTLDGTLKTGSGNVRNNLNQNSHPTVKPIKLMEYLIRLVTPPGGVVLDPFAGSGSTLVAAKNLGFEFIGIEMNEEYVEIARKRIGT